MNLALWDAAFARKLRRAGGARALVVQDVYSLQWEMAAGCLPGHVATHEATCQTPGGRSVGDVTMAHAVAVNP